MEIIKSKSTQDFIKVNSGYFKHQKVKTFEPNVLDETKLNNDSNSNCDFTIDIKTPELEVSESLNISDTSLWNIN